MAMSEQATVAIPQDVIIPIVQARIQAEIISALKGQQQLIEQAVVGALSMRVNSECKVDQYSSSNKFTLLEAMTNKYIREAAIEALKEFLETHAKESVKKRVAQEIQKKASPLAVALVDGLAKSIDTAYGFNLTVSLKQTGL